MRGRGGFSSQFQGTLPFQFGAEKVSPGPVVFGGEVGMALSTLGSSPDSRVTQLSRDVCECGSRRVLSPAWASPRSARAGERGAWGPQVERALDHHPSSQEPSPSLAVLEMLELAVTLKIKTSWGRARL